MTGEVLSLSEAIQELLKLTPDHTFQINQMDTEEYTVGWQTPEWPYISMRRGPDLLRTINEAIVHARKHQSPEYKAMAKKFAETTTDPSD